MCPVKCNAIHVVRFCVTLVNRKAVDGAQRAGGTVHTESAPARHQPCTSTDLAARFGKLARKCGTVKTLDWRFNSAIVRRRITIQPMDKCEVFLIYSQLPLFTSVNVIFLRLFLLSDCFLTEHRLNPKIILSVDN